MKLTFDRATVDKLIAHAKAAPEHRAPYGGGDPAPPGLFLVGDDGVYLFSNGIPPLMNPETTKHVVVYAAEVDPTKLPFEEWWANKQAGYGGDDGMDLLPLTDLERALATYPPDAPLLIESFPEQFGIFLHPSRRQTKKRP
jgi:hypothetical protein